MTRVILVDDNRVNAQLVKELLEMDGLDVVVCPSERKARAAADKQAAAFVIDCNLAAGREGLELLRAIRRGDTHAASDTPVFVISGDSRLAVEALNSGANQFWPKPFSPSALSSALQNIIASEDGQVGALG
ncbi:MAG: response regulator [Candidatus Promineifilaceae bacterium]